MFKNYLKTAWRNLSKNKFYSFINLFGLTTGLAIGILILLWVQDQRSYDQFNSKQADIYKLENRVGTGSSIQIWQSTNAAIGLMGKNELPQIKEFIRMRDNYTYSLFKYKDKLFAEDNATFTEPSIFTVFDFPLVKGNVANPFPDDYSIVMTEATAKKYFGSDDPIGKVISADDSVNFKVTGVIKDFPKNSSIKADFFLPMSLARKLSITNDPAHSIDNDFNQYNYGTYFLLQPGTDLKKLSKQLRDIHLRHNPDDTDIDYLFLPLSKMHLFKSDGTEAGMQTVRMFTIIALLILVIACINYVNLATARAMLRSKEVSLRKIVGAARSQLFLQFILETTMLFLMTAVMAIALAIVLVPLFNQITGQELAINLRDFQIWKIILVTIIGTLVISSIYPALLLSSFEPLKALKGKISTRISDAAFRKILVVTQFAVSIVLIVSTLIISKQLNYIHTKELGYNKDHVMYFTMRNLMDHYDALKADLLKRPGVVAVTRASSNIVQIGGQTGSNWWEGKQEGETMMVRPLAVDKDFIPFFKISLVTGNNFTGDGSDSLHYILNESAIARMGLKNPIGSPFTLWGNKGTIIGVVKDFHLGSMKNKIEPAVFLYNPKMSNKIYIKTDGQNASSVIAFTEDEWKRYNAGFNFNYTFLDDTFNNLYKGETRTGWLFDVFSLVAILISCLGLLGLATYTAQVRRREIGIRKVLGASVFGIVRLMATDFMKLVVISILIASPIAWYYMHSWLQDFAYKTNIGWMVFALAGLAAVLIAALAISFQAIKSALANPVKSIRTE